MGDDFILFHRAMKTIYRLAKSHAAVAVRDDTVCISRSTRPASSVHRDRSKRMISPRHSRIPKLARAGRRSSDSSQRVELSLSQSISPTSRASLRSDVSHLFIQEARLRPNSRLRVWSIKILVRWFDNRPMTGVTHTCRTHVSPPWIRGNKLSTVI